MSDEQVAIVDRAVQHHINLVAGLLTRKGGNGMFSAGGVGDFRWKNREGALQFQAPMQSLFRSAGSFTIQDSFQGFHG